MPLKFSILHLGDPNNDPPTIENILATMENLPLGRPHGTGTVIDHVVIDDTAHPREGQASAPLWIERVMSFARTHGDAAESAANSALRQLVEATWVAAWHFRDKQKRPENKA